MKIYRVITYVLILLFLAPLSNLILVSNGSASTTSELIDNYINEQISKSIIPGMAVGVIQEGKIIYADGNGKADNDNTPITNQSLFMVGEISQILTSMGILALQEDGLLNISNHVIDYLHTFGLSNSEYAARITVENCLRHQSGLSIDSGDNSEKKDKISDLILGLKDEKPIAAPGTVFEFSNANYWILGGIIEQITNQTFQDFITTRILHPLGMNQTYFDIKDARNNPNFAHGYRIWYGMMIPSRISHDTEIAPANGVLTNIEDLLKLMLAHLDYSNSNVTKNVLQPDSFQLLHSLSNPSSSSLNSSWAVGWYNFTFNDVEFLAQSGDFQDYHIEILLTPEDMGGIVVLTNVNSFFGNQVYYRNLADSIYNILNDQPPYYPFLSHVVLYILIMVVVIFVIGRKIWKFFGIKQQIEKQMEEKLISSQKRQVIWVDVIVHLVIIAILMLLIPFLFSLLIGLESSVYTLLSQFQPDMLLLLILLSCLELANTLYIMIVFRKKLF
ncbi:MAG: serine hydrolase domain-containing protein [Promethearchaeota archaeon]